MRAKVVILKFVSIQGNHAKLNHTRMSASIILFFIKI